MNFFSNYFMIQSMFQYNFLIILINFLISLSYYAFCNSKIFNQWNFLWLNNLVIQIFLLGGLILSFSFHCLGFFFYIKWVYFNYTFVICDFDLFFCPNLLANMSINITGLEFQLDIFGVIIIFLAYLVGIVSLIILDNKLVWLNYRYYSVFNLFIIVVYLYVSVTNIIVFFFLYECLLLPSFLFVYYVSYSRRAIQASLYFVIWTQIGSFLVLCGIICIVYFSGCVNFFNLSCSNLKSIEIYLILFFLFFGFGVKVPIWPFHYWLTKTHVEASSGFSIYLSGFLVKSALYGFYKIISNLYISVDVSLFIVIVVIGVVDASLKLYGQLDLKKIIAYCTIQEMNLIYLCFCWGDLSISVCGFLFSMAHGILSTFMFFVVDCVYRRYHTRVLTEVFGILQITPMLAFLIFIMCIFFSGFPFTLKFIVELYLFFFLIDFSVFLGFFLLFIVNVIGVIGFSKAWLNSIFGSPSASRIMDLSFRDIFISLYLLVSLVFFSFVSGLIFF